MACFEPTPAPTPSPAPDCSRRSFIRACAAAAALAALGPVGFSRPDHQASPLPRLGMAQAFADSASSGSQTIERYLGATKSALEELSAHEHDSYYLGTAYGNTGPGSGGNLADWDCWYPNGKPKSNGQAYMNCAGFIVAVLEACGADCDIVGSYVASSGYNRGNKANCSRWKNFLDDHASMRKSFATKSELLNSKTLQKGDIIIAEPNDWSAAGADNHIMFFWGDSPTHDLAWHSASHGDGIIAGKAPGNMISKITAKFSNVHWYRVPLENLIEMTLAKRSADARFADGAANDDAYSLQGATFRIYGSYSNGALSDLLAEVVTDASGEAKATLPAGAEVWVEEVAAPCGFVLAGEPTRVKVAESRTIEDEPCRIAVAIEKLDAETDEIPQGHAALDGAVFELEDARGERRSAPTCWNDDASGWIATFEDLPRGPARIRESAAPRGYLACPLQGADDDGWASLDLTPDSHEPVCAVTLPAHANAVMRGDIEGGKYRPDEGDDSQKTPLAGCEFAIWLQDDGTLAARGYEVGEIVDAEGNPVGTNDGTLRGHLMGSVATHDNGWFSSQDLLANWDPSAHNGLQRPNHALPFGTYTLVETACPEPSLRFTDPICNIQLHAEGARAFFILKDRLISSPVRVVKTDAKTGKPVLVPGTQVELLQAAHDGSWERIGFVSHYPDDRIIVSFALGEDGTVQFPEALQWGAYAIRETQAVAPYVLNATPVDFSIDEHHDWSDDAIVEVRLPNEAATGCIRGVKTDAQTGERVPRGTYEIRAADDIVGADATLHHAKGEVVATCTTNDDGTWQAEGLSLGRGTANYNVVEVAAPQGYQLDTTVHHVALTYQDQHTPQVSRDLPLNEEPTRLGILKVDAATKEGIEGVVFSVADAESGQEAARVTTDAQGEAAVLRLACDTTYRISEVEPRYDLGYVAGAAPVDRYLSPEGRWFSSKEAYEAARAHGNSTDEVAAAGAANLALTFENDFTKVAVFKVDADVWSELASACEGDGADDAALKALAHDAKLAGGNFRLLDEEGNPVAAMTDGAVREQWRALGEDPVLLSHLRPATRYAIEELEAPRGYRPSKEPVSFVTREDGSLLTLVLPNETGGIPKTADLPRSKALAPAGIAAAAAATAFAAYSKRRASLEG